MNNQLLYNIQQSDTIRKQGERIDELTAHNAAMQKDAVNNTATIKMLMAQLAEQVEENRGMRIQLGWSPK